MTALDYVAVSTGQVFDTVTLDGDRLRFATGAAEQMFTTWRERFGWSDVTTFQYLSRWSNGYAALRLR